MDGLSSSFMDGLSQELASRPVALLPGEKVRIALAEAGVSEKCSDVQALSIGKALGAQYVFNGLLLRDNSGCVLQGKLFDIDNIQALGTVQASGGTECDSLSGAATHLAQRIAQHLPGRAVDSTAAPRKTSLLVKSEPAGATVTVNGLEVGTTPCEAIELLSGAYKVEVQLDGYKPFTKEISVSADKRKSVKIKLAPLHGALTVLSTPPNAMVSLNGSEVGTTPYSDTHLDPGRYAIRCMLRNYLPDSLMHTVARGRHDTIRVHLLSADSVKAARVQSKKRGRIVRRMLLGACGLGFGIAGAIANGQARDYIEAEDAARDNYLRPGLSASEYDQYWNDYTAAGEKAYEAATTRNVLYGISVAFVIGAAIPFWRQD